VPSLGPLAVAARKPKLRRRDGRPARREHWADCAQCSLQYG